MVQIAVYQTRVVIFFFSFRVQSLILADPWGFPERDPDPEKRRPIPLWVRGVIGVVSLFNPLAGIRAAGPWGKFDR